MQVNNPTGISIFTLLRLFSWALMIVIFLELTLALFLGTLISLLPDKYFAVIESLFFKIAS